MQEAFSQVAVFRVCLRAVSVGATEASQEQGGCVRLSGLISDYLLLDYQGVYTVFHCWTGMDFNLKNLLLQQRTLILSSFCFFCLVCWRIDEL